MSCDSPNINSGFQRFRKIGTVIVVFAPTDCVVETREGKVQCSKGDAILTGVEGEQWPVSRVRFDEMYEPAGEFAHGSDGQYQKRPTAYTLAKQMDAPFTVIVGQGDVIMGQAGDWLTQYADGQQGIVADDIFRKTYQQV